MRIWDPLEVLFSPHRAKKEPSKEQKYHAAAGYRTTNLDALYFKAQQRTLHV
jgi:hypothetical protein